VATIRIEQVGGRPRFAGPAKVSAGAVLRVVNRTRPSRVGPHTFSLVVPGALPHTVPARRECFAPGRICEAIARWHGAKGNGPPQRSLARAGLPGWGTKGAAGRRGDSWFSGYRQGAAVEQPLAADAGGTIHFLCAIHPWMQGQFEVSP